jgi:hypothetical protein
MLRKIFGTLLLTSLVAGCASGPQISTEYDKTADFSKYKSFGFITPLGTDVSGYESFVTRQIKTAVTKELVAKGLTYSENASDLLVNFNAKIQDKVSVSQMPASMSYYGYRGRMYTGWNNMYDTSVHQYKEGTLNVDVVDAKRKQLVWEGVAVGQITDKTPEERAVKINGVVQEIFMQYPFPTKK